MIDGYTPHMPLHGLHELHAQHGMGIDAGENEQAAPEAIPLKQPLHDDGIQHRSQANQCLREPHPHDSILDKVIVECGVGCGQDEAKADALNQAKREYQMQRRLHKDLQSRAQ